MPYITISYYEKMTQLSILYYRSLTIIKLKITDVGTQSHHEFFNSFHSNIYYLFLNFREFPIHFL